MSEPKWIETKKECEVSERGELIPKKVTLELEKEKENPWKYKPKEIIDLSFRLIGLFAIALPVYLFYKGQEADRNKQNALFRLGVYSKTATELHSLVDQDLGSKEFEENKARLLYEDYPKLVFINDKSIIDTFAAVQNILIYYSSLWKALAIADTTHSLLGKYLVTTHDPVTNEDRKELLIDSNSYKSIVDQLYNSYITLRSLDNDMIKASKSGVYYTPLKILNDLLKDLSEVHWIYSNVESKRAQKTGTADLKKSLYKVYGRTSAFALVNGSDFSTWRSNSSKRHRLALMEYADRLDSMMVESHIKALQLP